MTQVRKGAPWPNHHGLSIRGTSSATEAQR